MRINELILYRKFAEGRDGLLQDMAGLVAQYEESVLSRGNVPALRNVFYSCIHELLDLAGTYGFHGNLWHCYLAHLLVIHENSYSRGCEMRGEIEGTVNEAALHDMGIFQELFRHDFSLMCRQLHVPEFSMVEDYESSCLESRVYNFRICESICDLAGKLRWAESPREMKDILAQFYKEHGVGKFGLHKSFRIVRVQGEGAVRIEPIPVIAHVALKDLIGYELPKRRLVENTEAFLEGRAANNCLLYGDAGTGKSTCIKALANEYYDRGLRVVEVYRHQFQDLNQVIGQMKNRNYKFIIFMDDLSFEDFETEYKYLKAVIEGGLEKKPENILIYATSNRRHLIRDNYSDKEEIRQDMHTSDTVQEKLSLAYRFGARIYFGAPDKRQFQEIVLGLASRHGIEMGEEELLLEASRWELSQGGLSGRTAQQFINYLSGKEGNPE